MYPGPLQYTVLEVTLEEYLGTAASGRKRGPIYFHGHNAVASISLLAPRSSGLRQLRGSGLHRKQEG